MSIGQLLKKIFFDDHSSSKNKHTHMHTCIFVQDLNMGTKQYFCCFSSQEQSKLDSVIMSYPAILVNSVWEEKLI